MRAADNSLQQYRTRLAVAALLLSRQTSVEKQFADLLPSVFKVLLISRCPTLPAPLGQAPRIQPVGEVVGASDRARTAPKARYVQSRFDL